MGRINQAHPILLFISLRFSNFSNTLGDALRVHMRMAEPAFGIIAGYLIHAWYPGENGGLAPRLIGFVFSFFGTKMFIDLALRNGTVVFCG